MSSKIAVQIDWLEYNTIEYNNLGRFNSFWHQVDSVVKFKSNRVLEIGTGNGFVRSVLKKYGMQVTTVDIDEKLQPDICASVLDMPFISDNFDVALCCQVLEHLPYDNFLPALREIHRVVKDGMVLSLPDLHRAYRFLIQIPIFGELKFLYTIPRLRSLPWEFNGEHYWNILCEGYMLDRIKNTINEAGFQIESDFCVFEMPWHRFFILKKVTKFTLPCC